MDPSVISGLSVCVCVCANHVCLGALVVAKIGEKCAVHVRSNHDRHNHTADHCPAIICF